MKAVAITAATLATGAVSMPNGGPGGNGGGNGGFGVGQGFGKGGWWAGGAPDCAQSCLSSHYATATSINWPNPSEYCAADQSNNIGACISSACTPTPTAYSSYSSLSSSLCSHWASCSSAGSTGVYTLTAPTSWSSDGLGDKWHGWNDDVTKTWTGGVYTITGCQWDGPNPWGGGPGGWGDDNAWGGWGDWGHGWTWSTHTTSVDGTLTVAGATSSVAVINGEATLAVADNGDSQNTYVLNVAQAATTDTASNDTSSASGALDSLLGVKVVGALLVGAVAAVGLL